MSNRTLFFMTALVIVAMAVLFALNMKTITGGKPDTQKYLKYNEVRGIAVEHNQMLYTLNFKQQNAVIEILNRAVPIAELKEGTRQKTDIQKIVVYQFEKKPDLIITPLTYLNGNLVFTQPEWNKDGYLMEMSSGELQQILSQSYDH